MSQLFTIQLALNISFFVSLLILFDLANAWTSLLHQLCSNSLIILLFLSALLSSLPTFNFPAFRLATLIFVPFIASFIGILSLSSSLFLPTILSNFNWGSIPAVIISTLLFFLPYFVSIFLFGLLWFCATFLVTFLLIKCFPNSENIGQQYEQFLENITKIQILNFFKELFTQLLFVSFPMAIANKTTQYFLASSYYSLLQPFSNNPTVVTITPYDILSYALAGALGFYAIIHIFFTIYPLAISNYISTPQVSLQTIALCYVNLLVCLVTQSSLALAVVQTKLLGLPVSIPSAFMHTVFLECTLGIYVWLNRVQKSLFIPKAVIISSWILGAFQIWRMASHSYQGFISATLEHTLQLSTE